MKTTIKKVGFQLFKIIFAIAIIYWLISSGKLNFSALKKLLSPELALPIVLLILLNFALVTERWSVLLKTQNILSTRWSVFKLTMIGSFFNFAMPGGVGGDVVKAYYFGKEHPGTRVVAITSVLIDRIIGLYAMIMLAMIVMLIDIQHVFSIPALVSLFYLVLFLFTSCTIGLSVCFSTYIYQKTWLKKLLNVLPLKKHTHKLYESMHLYGHSSRTIYYTIALSFVAQISSVMMLVIAGQATGIEAPLKTYFLVAPIGFMATAIPISPAGVGIGQAAFYSLFNVYLARSTELGPTVITAFQVVTFLISLSGAFFYLQRKDRAELSNVTEAT